MNIKILIPALLLLMLVFSCRKDRQCVCKSPVPSHIPVIMVKEITYKKVTKKELRRLCASYTQHTGGTYPDSTWVTCELK